MIPADVGLKDYYDAEFLIGAALNRRQITGESREQMDLIAREYNSYTAENDMKSMHIHPTLDEYNFEVPDKLFELQKRMEPKCMDIPWFGTVSFPGF